MSYVVGRTQTRTLRRLPLNLTSVDFQLFGFWVFLGSNPVFLTFYSPLCNIGIQKNYTHCFENSVGARKIGSTVKNTGCSHKGPRFNFLHPHDISESPITPLPEGSETIFHPPEALYGYGTHRYICRQNTPPKK